MISLVFAYSPTFTLLSSRGGNPTGFSTCANRFSGSGMKVNQKFHEASSPDATQRTGALQLRFIEQ